MRTWRNAGPYSSIPSLIAKGAAAVSDVGREGRVGPETARTSPNCYAAQNQRHQSFMAEMLGFIEADMRFLKESKKSEADEHRG
jgi:hypothetical protein